MQSCHLPPAQRQSCKQTALWRNAGLCDLPPRVLLQCTEFSWNSPPHAAPPQSSASPYPSLRPHRVEKNTPLSPNTTASHVHAHRQIWTDRQTHTHTHWQTSAQVLPFFTTPAVRAASSCSFNSFSSSSFEELFQVKAIARDFLFELSYFWRPHGQKQDVSTVITTKYNVNKSL